MELRDWLRVDVKAGKPLFDQLRTQVIDGVRAGALPPGTRLPTVRDLAGQLGVAANTVARAYRELESAAIVETRGRFGTFISRFDPTDAAMGCRGQGICRRGASAGADEVRCDALSHPRAGRLNSSKVRHGRSGSNTGRR